MRSDLSFTFQFVPAIEIMFRKSYKGNCVSFSPCRSTSFSSAYFFLQFLVLLERRSVIYYNIWCICYTTERGIATHSVVTHVSRVIHDVLHEARCSVSIKFWGTTFTVIHQVRIPISHEKCIKIILHHVYSLMKSIPQLLGPCAIKENPQQSRILECMVNDI